MSNKGRAYAFFNCSKSKERIEQELPLIRRVIEVPAQLEILLREGVNLSDFPDQDIRKIAEEFRDQGARYSIIGSYDGATNRQTAVEISSTLNQAYQSPLFNQGE